MLTVVGLKKQEQCQFQTFTSWNERLPFSHGPVKTVDIGFTI